MNNYHDEDGHMQLYCFPTPRNVCVFALIDHVGATIERISIDLIKGEHKDAKFAAINPNMKTPVLVDGDFTLWEHPAIMPISRSKRALISRHRR